MSKFLTKYYQSLENATILRFIGMGDDEFGGKPFPKFLVRFADGSESEIEISQDEEGNGGGFIYGLYVPEVATK